MLVEKKPNNVVVGGVVFGGNVVGGNKEEYVYFALIYIYFSVLYIVLFAPIPNICKIMVIVKLI